MASFSQAIDIVLDLEGGYQNDPADWGNYNAYDADGDFVPYARRRGRTLRAGTNRGISAMLYSSLLKREVSVAQMQAVSVADARQIYRQAYWDKVRGDQIQNQALANLIFDSKVNHGGAGIKIVQKVINALGYSEPLTVDGIVGPKTLKAINSVAPARLNNSILDAREKFYRYLANNRPGNDRFLKGWLNRLKRFPRMNSGSTHTRPPVKKSSSSGMGLFIAALIGLTLYNNE